MNFSNPTRALFKQRLLAVAILGMVLLLLFATSRFPDFIEHYFSRGIYPVIAVMLHSVFNVLPLSAGDIFYLLLIGALMYAAIKLIRLAIHKQFSLMGYFSLKIVMVVQMLIAVFYLFWGLNYFRPAVAQSVGLQDTSYTLTDVKTITALLIDSANAQAAIVTQADRHQTNAAIYRQAIQAIQILGKSEPAFHDIKPAVKPSLFTPLINYMGTLGYYNPFTGEAQVNYQMPVVNKPVTCAHEMGHQMGYGREDEANFIGFRAGIQSPNHLLSYSAYYMGALEFLYYLRRRDTVAHHQLKRRLSAAVRQDVKADSTYWTSYESKIGAISSIFYDQFLKANNQPSGLFTYNRMIRLTMAYYKRRYPQLFEKSKPAQG
jgi:hypothetical protein